MSLYVGSFNFWAAVIFCLVVGSVLIRFAIVHSDKKGAAWVVGLTLGAVLVVVGAGLVIATPLVTKWDIVTFVSPEGTQIESHVQTSVRLPNISERVIVNPKPVGDLLAEWDTLLVEEKQKRLEELLVDPRTSVWTKPAGSDEFEWLHWEDLLDDDKNSVLQRIPELEPRYDF